MFSSHFVFENITANFQPWVASTHLTKTYCLLFITHAIFCLILVKIVDANIYASLRYNVVDAL